jgi:PPM family protein phosphatase
MNIKDQDLLPYLIITGAFLLLLLLVYLRSKTLGSTEQRGAKPLIGNGQILGKREEQDDYFSTASTVHGTIAVLADGISGLSHGRMASTLAVSAFIREFYKLDSTVPYSAFLEHAASLSNRQIIEQLGGAQGGTTLVAAIITGERMLYWGAVGDSMITIFRKGEFIPVNHRHTLESVLEGQVLDGKITKSEAELHPHRGRLINYLGYEGFKRMEIGKEPIQLEYGDRVLLYSDGVSNALTELELERILLKRQPPYDAAQEMMEAVEAKQLGKQDNATVIILDIGS